MGSCEWRWRCGADIIDVGGESTRPPAVYADTAPTSENQELSRVIPVIEALTRDLAVPVSVDTYKAAVSRAAIKAGAAMINDVWGFRRDPDMAGAAAEAGVPVVLMHNQDHYEYDDLLPDVIGALRHMRDTAIDAGIAVDSIILDPGMGFGKTAEQSLALLKATSRIREEVGRPLLVGPSRKSFIGAVTGLPAQDRLMGTCAAVAAVIQCGADAVRIHDVGALGPAVQVADAIRRTQPRREG